MKRLAVVVLLLLGLAGVAGAGRSSLFPAEEVEAARQRLAARHERMKTVQRSRPALRPATGAGADYRASLLAPSPELAACLDARADEQRVLVDDCARRVAELVSAAAATPFSARLLELPAGLSDLTLVRRQIAVRHLVGVRAGALVERGQVAAAAQLLVDEMYVAADLVRGGGRLLFGRSATRPDSLSRLRRLVPALPRAARAALLADLDVLVAQRLPLADFLYVDEVQQAAHAASPRDDVHVIATDELVGKMAAACPDPAAERTCAAGLNALGEELAARALAAAPAAPGGPITREVARRTSIDMSIGLVFGLYEAYERIVENQEEVRELRDELARSEGR